jgi:hypothetical protein
VTKGNLQRTAATNLAAEQIQLARSTSAINIPTGASPARTVTVANTVYTINQSAKYLASDSTTSVCDGASASLAYKLVTVTVTWEGMGQIKPVRVDTLKAFGVGSDGLGSTGALAIQVAGADGTGKAGLTVTLSNGTTTVSDTDGCAIFVGVAVGTYSATINAPGYVGAANTQLNTKSGLGVTIGNLSRVSFTYDQARSFNIRVDSPVAGAQVPTTIPMLFSATSLPETTFPACTSTAPIAACSTSPTATVDGVVKELYPAIITLRLGTCTQTPASQITSDIRPIGTVGSTVTVPLGAITVTVAKALSATTPIAGRTVTFTHGSPNTGCTSADTYTVITGSTPTSLALPYGTWTVSTPVYNSSGQPTAVLISQNVTVSPTTRTQPSTLVVSL